MHIPGVWCHGCLHLDRFVDNPLAALDEDTPCFNCAIDFLEYGVASGWELGLDYFLRIQRLREAHELDHVIDPRIRTRS